MEKSTRPPSSASPPHAPADVVFEKGLPSDPLAEKFCLGSVLISPGAFEKISSLSADDFSTEKYRRIYSRMQEMAAAETPIDRLTLADALWSHGQLESVGGYSELVSLDEGMPALENVDGWVKIVKDKAALRRLIFTGQKLIDGALLLEQSPQELAGQLRQTLEEVEQSGTQDDGGSTPLQIVEGFPGGINAFLDPSARPKGLPTGFTRFDSMTSGMHPKEVIILAARPGGGKTALSLNIVAHLTLNEQLRKHVAFFSLEMSKSSILNRLMCSHARVDAHKWRMGFLNAEERRRLQVALAEVQEAKLRIYDQSGITMPEITKRIRRLAKEEALHLAVIDYMQLIGSHGRVENRNQEVSIISRQFKMLASELEIPLIVLSQLSRQGEHRRGNMQPILSDLRDSGSIEQDADVIAFIFREEMYRRDRDDLKGLADLIVAKQRNGPIGTVPLRFLSQFVRFENRASDLDQE